MSLFFPITDATNEIFPRVVTFEPQLAVFLENRLFDSNVLNRLENLLIARLSSAYNRFDSSRFPVQVLQLPAKDVRVSAVP